MTSNYVLPRHTHTIFHSSISLPYLSWERIKIKTSLFCVFWVCSNVIQVYYFFCQKVDDGRAATRCLNLHTQLIMMMVLPFQRGISVHFSKNALRKVLELLQNFWMSLAYNSKFFPAYSSIFVEIYKGDDAHDF